MTEPQGSPEGPHPSTSLEESKAILTGILSGVSSYAYEELSSLDKEAPDSYREIGKGSCGYVFTHSRTPNLIIKRAVSPAFNNALSNDFTVHRQLADAFYKFGMLPGWKLPYLPKCFSFTPASSQDSSPSETKTPTQGAAPEWPNDYKDMLPTDYLTAERIHPLPLSACNALIEIYCPMSGRAPARAMPANQDCLLRLYLGMRREFKPSMFFALRNFPLYVNRAEEFGVDVMGCAMKMAGALAVMHWDVGIDAGDVEFVLGSATVEEHTIEYDPGWAELSKTKDGVHEGESEFTKRPHNSYPNPPTPCHSSPTGPPQRHISLWLLDFDKCHPIRRDADGVELAVKAFLRNDRYYPMPLTQNQNDERIWVVFRDAYLDRSRAVLDGYSDEGENVRVLPERFVRRLVEERGKLLERMGVGRG